MSGSKECDSQRKPILPFSIDEILKKTSDSKASLCSSNPTKAAQILRSEPLLKMSKGKQFIFSSTHDETYISLDFLAAMQIS